MRRLASDLGINLHTVRRAYLELETEGWLQLGTKKLAVITDKAAPFATADAPAATQTLRTQLATTVAAAHTARLTRETFDLLIDQLWPPTGSTQKPPHHTDPRTGAPA